MTRRPAIGPTRRETRRQQILDAASECACKAGFHGASMAEIAQASGLSIGQIYRDFANKEAIIAALVDRNLDTMREKFDQFEGAGEPLAEVVINQRLDALEQHYDPERAALMLEVMAEAARNPRVGAIVRTSDVAEREMKLDFLRKLCPPGTPAQVIEARGEVLSMLFEGMIMRGVSNPCADREAIGDVLASTLRHLLTEWGESPAANGVTP